MSSYVFSTVKIVPSLVRNEPVNIGVILHDVGNGRVYRKFTENRAELKRRTGIDRLPDYDEVTSVAANDGYLESLAVQDSKDNLVVTEPKQVAPINTPKETLEALFRIQISLAEKHPQGKSPLQKLARSLDGVIESMDFPRKSYETQYAFSGSIIDRKFPYVFFKLGSPRLCIDYLSFAGNVLNHAKVKSFDIDVIRESQKRSRAGQKTRFKILAAQDRDEVDVGKKSVRKSLEVLEHSKIPVVYKKDAECEIDSIHKSLAATA